MDLRSKLVAVRFLAWTLVLSAAIAGAEETPTYPVLFVSPAGDDAWSGTLPDPSEDGKDGPFRTPHRALEVLRTLATETGHPNGATIYLREGDYFLEQPLALDARDSGIERAPVLWRNFRQEAVRWVGGVEVAGFEPHEGEVLQAKLADDLKVPALYFNGNRQPLARWPNEGTGDLPGGGWTFTREKIEADAKKSYVYDAPRPERWSSMDGVQVSIWPNYNWWQTIADVTAIDTGKQTITLAEDLPYTIEPGRRFFYQNVFEELDAPGEWFFDKSAATLYFWPPSELAESAVLVPVLDHLVTIDGGAHINVMGITFEATRQAAVKFTDATACMLAKSVVRHTGGFGVQVTGGEQCRVLGNDVYHTARGGIVLDGGDRKTLTPGGHEAVNNHIHHFGQVYRTYQTAVNVRGVSNRVAQNLIHDAPHIGILLGGNDHVLEYNEIHHVCLEGSDNGGFYMGRDWTARGNIIRFNKFHDIYGFGLSRLRANDDGVFEYESPHQAWGVYLDDCSSGVQVYGNLFYRVPLCGVMVGGGRDNEVLNNIFVECVPAYHIDDRWDSYTWETMFKRLDDVNHDEPPYSERYPKLLELGDDPRKPENNRFERNIISYRADSFRGLSTTKRTSDGAVVYDLDQFDPESTVFDNNLIYHYDQPIRIAWSVYGPEPQRETIVWGQWLRRGFDANSIVEDPMFLDPSTDDYQLLPKSPAEKIKFEPLPLHRMGLINDEYRATPVPPKDDRREGWKHTSYPVTLQGAGSP